MDRIHHLALVVDEFMGLDPLVPRMNLGITVNADHLGGLGNAHFEPHIGLAVFLDPAKVIELEGEQDGVTIGGDAIGEGKLVDHRIATTPSKLAALVVAGISHDVLHPEGFGVNIHSFPMNRVSHIS